MSELGYNKVILVGRLTKDPKFFSNGKKRVEIRIAVNREWGKKENEKDVCYVDCKAWDGHAENISIFFKMGDPILVEGHLRNDKWTNGDGSKANVLRVYIDSWDFMETKKSKDFRKGNSTSNETEYADDSVESEETTPEDFDALVEKAVNGN